MNVFLCFCAGICFLLLLLLYFNNEYIRISTPNITAPLGYLIKYEEEEERKKKTKRMTSDTKMFKASICCTDALVWHSNCGMQTFLSLRSVVLCAKELFVCNVDGMSIVAFIGYCC